MAIVEDVTEEDYGADPGPSSTAELISSMRELSSRLSLPDELLPSFLHEENRESILNTFRELSVLIDVRTIQRKRRWRPMSSMLPVSFGICSL